METEKKKTLQEIIADMLAGKNYQSTNVMNDLDTTQNISTDELARRHAEDNQDEEIDTATIIKAQPFVDDINGKQEEDDVDGIADGILVVTDPEISSEEFEEVADELQGIVDETEAGEIPFTDKYEGNYILGCPICGGTFVSDVLLDSGEDACPICCKVPDSFVVNGKIESTDAVESQDELQSKIDDIENQEEPVKEKEPNIPETLDKDENLLDNEEEETPLKGESKKMVGKKLTEEIRKDSIWATASDTISYLVDRAMAELEGDEREDFLQGIIGQVKELAEENNLFVESKKLTEDEDLEEVKDDIEETVENDTTDEVSKDVISSTIDVLIADEESAIDGYNSYLNQAEQTVSTELFDTLKEQIDEIIADEQEHIEKLNTIKDTLQGNVENEEDKENEEVEEMEESKKVEAKSDYNYVVQGNYGYGWDDLVTEETMEDAKKTKQEYEENEPEYKHRIKTIRADGSELTESKKIEEDNNDKNVIFTTEVDYTSSDNSDFRQWLEDVYGEVDEEDIDAYIEEYDENQNEAVMEYWEENIKPMIEEQLCTEDLLILMGTANTWNKSGDAARCFSGMNDFDNMLSDYDAVTICDGGEEGLSIELGHHDGTHYMNMYTFNGDAEGVYNKLIELHDSEFANDNYEDFDEVHSMWSDYDLVTYMIDMHQSELKQFLVPIKNNLY